MSFMDAWNKGVAAGTQQRQGRTLRELFQPALSGDANALAGLHKEGLHEQAMQAQTYAGQQQKAQQDAKSAAMEQVGKLAAAYASNPHPLVWKQLHAAASQAIPEVAQMPGDLATPEDQQGALEFAKAIGGAYGGMKAPEPFTLSPGSKRFNPDGSVMAEVPFAPKEQQFTLYDGADGPVWLPKPTGAPSAAPPSAGPSGGAPGVLDNAYRGALDPVQDFPRLSQGFGAQVSSLHRTPEHNAKVGGVPNSYHVRGQAGDFVVPPEQRPAFIQRARSMGYDAIDEGDHVHVEPRRGAPVASAFGQGQGVGAIPVTGVRPKPKAQDKPSELERRVELARSMGATEDQVRQIVLGETGGGKPSATQIKLANTAKAKLIDLQAIEAQLAQVERAFKPLQGSYSAGIGGGLIPSVEGKRFDGAVGLLQGMVRKLTRTPGEGAMSDYETKLAQLANPSRNDYEDVTADKIQQLRALIQTTRQGYEALLQDAGGNSRNLTGNTPQTVTTKAQYDALPSGAIYIEDGKRYRKP